MLLLLSLRMYLIVIVVIKSFVLCRPKHHFTASMGLYQKQYPKQFVQWINGKLNISHRRKLRLYSSKSKRFIQVKNKVVNAKGSDQSVFGKLIIESVGYGLVRIKGTQSQRYVCFNPSNAKLRAQKNGDDLNCVFHEKYNYRTYGTYFTAFNENWYIAVKNNGKIKRGDNWTSNITLPRKNETFEFREKTWR